MQKNLNLFDRALILLNSNSFEESIELFMEDLKNNPQNPLTFNNIGLAHGKLGILHKDESLLELAIQYFEKAIAFTEFAPVKSFPNAENNLKWAREELTRLT